MSTSSPADPFNSNARRRAAASAAAASIGGGILGTAPAEAAVVLVDVSSISGINAGLAPGNSTTFNITAANGNFFEPRIRNFPSSNNYDSIGFDFNGFGFGVNGLIAYGDYQRTGVSYPKAATPNAFSAGTVIDSSVFANSDGNAFGSGSTFREFYGIAYVSPDITNKYLAFRTNTVGTGADPNYGWINVTWNSSTSQFQILGAAYESDAGVAIQTPSGPATSDVPGPAPLLGLAAMVNGARALRRLRAARLRQTAGTASS